MTHDHGHSHGHSHSHTHSHAVGDYNRSFALGVLLNLTFVLVEIVYGLRAESLALISDAGHNFSDVLSLLLAWGASVLAAKSATERHTYGFRKATIMASLVSAVLLFIALGAIAWEAVGRLLNPPEVNGQIVITVAFIGVIINTITALLFVRGQKHDLNIRGAFLHMAIDAAVSLGVVVAGILIVFTNWLWLDPTISLLIMLVIVSSAWSLLRDSVNYAIDAVPKHIDIAEIKAYLIGLDNVTAIHDLHVWPLSTTEVALTVHLIASDAEVSNVFLREVQQHLHDQFGIEHSTLQVESSHLDNVCMLDKHSCG